MHPTNSCFFFFLTLTEATSDSARNKCSHCQRKRVIILLTYFLENLVLFSTFSVSEKTEKTAELWGRFASLIFINFSYSWPKNEKNVRAVKTFATLRRRLQRPHIFVYILLMSLKFWTDYYLLVQTLVNYGILSKMVCESRTSYICNVKLYSERGNNMHDTITEVLEPYLDKWYNTSLIIVWYVYTMSKAESVIPSR